VRMCGCVDVWICGFADLRILRRMKKKNWECTLFCVYLGN